VNTTIDTQETDRHHVVVVHGSLPACAALECHLGTGAYQDASGAWWCREHESSYAFMLLGARLGFPDFEFARGSHIAEGPDAWRQFSRLFSVTAPAPLLLCTLTRAILYEECQTRGSRSDTPAEGIASSA
jgi:hypothetical protein